MNKRLNVTCLKYHRNGICGIGFSVATFTYHDGHEPQKAIATIFNADEFSGYCAVILLDEEGRPRIDCPMRGDLFEGELRDFIESPKGKLMMFPHLANEAAA